MCFVLHSSREGSLSWLVYSRLTHLEQSLTPFPANPPSVVEAQTRSTVC